MLSLMVALYILVSSIGNRDTNVGEINCNEFILQIEDGENDSTVVLKMLEKSNSMIEILEVFANIQGPYAFIYWQVIMECHNYDTLKA